MRSLALAPLLVACACGTDPTGGAGAGGEGGGAGGDGGQPNGCVDIISDFSKLPEGHAADGLALAGGVWRGPDSVRLAWTAFQYLDQQQFSAHERLVLEEYSLSDGSLSEMMVVDVFDPTLDSTEANLVMATGEALTGRVVAFASHDNAGHYRLIDSTGLLGPEEEDPFAGLGIATHTSWDGEAFAIHGHSGGPPRPFTVARIATDGALLLPPTQYGEGTSACFCPAGYTLATDPIGGRTWLVDPLAQNSASAHERDGTAIFDPPLDLGVGSAAVAVDAYPGGLDVAWAESTPYSNWVLRLDDAGQVIFGPQKLVAPAEDLAFVRLAVHRMPDGRMLVVGAGIEGAAYYFFVDPATGEETPRELFFDDSTYAQDQMTDLRMMTAWDDAYGTWVAFNEAIGSDPPSPAWRVLKLAPGCVYPSWREAHQVK